MKRKRITRKTRIKNWYPRRVAHKDIYCVTQPEEPMVLLDDEMKAPPKIK